MTSKMRILVADDSMALRVLLQGTLRAAGYEVITATNGDDLVRLAQEQVPDLLLVDLMMPMMDGYEAIRQLRNDTRTSHLPMIILTALSDSTDVVTGFDSGADDYVVKPFNTAALLARIRGHLRRDKRKPVRNPLTGLPGNVLLQVELQRNLGQKQDFSLIYVDLDNFKAFNDVYGFARGDRAIQTLADVLSQTVKSEGFLAHIGGDDFAIIYNGTEVEPLCRKIILAFEAVVRSLYDPQDVQRGYLLGHDRQGKACRFGMLSLSIAVVSADHDRFQSVDEIGKVAAELKSQAKLIPGNSYKIDERLPRERRDHRRPIALLICADDTLRSALASALRFQGYLPLATTNSKVASSLLHRMPDPALLVVDASLGEELWSFWRKLASPPPLLAIAADSAAAEAAYNAGAYASIANTADIYQVVIQLVQHLPSRPEIDQEGTKEIPDA